MYMMRHIVKYLFFMKTYRSTHTDDVFHILPSFFLMLAFVSFAGCGGGGFLKGGPSEKEQIQQVMQQWVQGWSTFDADLLVPIVADNWYGVNGENKEQLLYYVRLWRQNPENHATFLLDEMEIDVLNDHATVRGVWADIKVEESDIVSKFRLNYTLEKENGAWKMTGSTLAG